jgi:crotonobetainyl-CoA:carnitine CoA-transferase CaiB-like acyl-CoA transferase
MATNSDRVGRHDEVIGRIAAVLSERTTSEWMEIFTEYGVNADVINTLQQVAADPQVVGLGILGGTAGAPTYIGMPMSFDAEVTATPLPPAPMLGEHTAEVASELGYDAAAIAELFGSGALRGGDGLIPGGATPVSPS